MPIVEGLFGVFPTVLFRCFDDMSPMHFILSLKQPFTEDSEYLVKVMQHCGAEVSFSSSESSDYSVLLVDHNDIIEFYGPAFSVKYIYACLEAGRLLDISDYRQEASSHIAKDAECMNVVYFRYECWNSYLSEADKQWISNYSVKNCDYNLTPTTKAKLIINPISYDTPSSTTEPYFNDSGHYEDESENQVCDTSIGNSTILAFNGGHYEDESENQVCDTSIGNSTILAFNGLISSTTIEESPPVGSLDPNIVDVNYCESYNDKILEFKENSNNSNIGSNDNKNKVKSHVNKEVYNKENTNLKKMEVCLNKSTTASPTKKWNFSEEFKPCGITEKTKPSPVNKHTKKLYSMEERSNILKFIVEHNEYGRIKGRELWTSMERRKVCSSRTWQSMKEHFIKKIIFDLDSYSFLTNEQKRKIRSVCFGVSR